MSEFRQSAELLQPADPLKPASYPARWKSRVAVSREFGDGAARSQDGAGPARAYGPLSAETPNV